MLGLTVIMDEGVWMEVREMKMKREYSTWYRNCSDTKIKKKEKNNYLCNNKIPYSMVLGCIHIYILSISLH